MDLSRYHKNTFEDYPNPRAGSIVNADTKELNEAFREILTAQTKRLLRKLEERRDYWIYTGDYSVYTGVAGIAYLFYKYAKCFSQFQYLEEAIELLEDCLRKFRRKREITFLTGIAGPIALSAVVYYAHGNNDKSQDMIYKLKLLASHVVDEHSNHPDELLYGRTGYLSSILFVNSIIQPPPIEDEIFREVVGQIIKSGNLFAMSKNCKTHLKYAWHDTEYIGAAHGVGGILYVLLQARKYLTQTQIERDIKPTLQYLQGIRYPSGNFPSSVGSETDKLIHWCHGAPGMTMLFCLAHEVFQDSQYLQTAIDCGEVVWQKGLLKKGYGICHGVSGNAYTFLCLYRHTKVRFTGTLQDYSGSVTTANPMLQFFQDIKYLYRACKFAEWCFDYDKHQCRTPDAPFSLFEGLAGVIYFLIDLHYPHLAKFPAYTV